MNKEFEKKMGRGTGPILKIKRVDFYELSKQIGEKLEKRSEKHRAEEKEKQINQ